MTLSARERVRKSREEMSELHRKPEEPTIDREAVRYFVYRLHDASGAVIYVGRSCDVARRIRAHASYPVRSWITDARDVSMFGPMTWDEAVRAERAEIGRLQPRGNEALTTRDHRPGVARRSVQSEAVDPRRCPTCGRADG